MLRNWYAVYTKPGREKKVSALLNKRGITSYCPLNYVTSDQTAGANKRGNFEPLFYTQVFVFVSGAALHTVKNTPGVTGLAYWKALPAIISAEEIEAIQKITKKYINIKLQKADVQEQQKPELKEEPVFTYNQNAVRTKYRTYKVVLPSLGCMLSAEKEKAASDIIQPDFNNLSFFQKRLAALFAN
ncbi:MAG TPA: UpxY family transcription antiterminator [Ferruginibacter sp.]|nr:UpxY family transcription antiterminator [Ferruginibacter sp.]HMP19903.1 UpxY family transcription antiterminator [Ferruginibacter sp.]